MRLAAFTLSKGSLLQCPQALCPTSQLRGQAGVSESSLPTAGPPATAEKPRRIGEYPASHLPSHMGQRYKWGTWNRRHSWVLQKYCSYSEQPKLSCKSGSETVLRGTMKETGLFLNGSQKDAFQNTRIPGVCQLQPGTNSSKHTKFPSSLLFPYKVKLI